MRGARGVTDQRVGDPAIGFIATDQAFSGEETVGERHDPNIALRFAGQHEAGGHAHRAGRPIPYHLPHLSAVSFNIELNVNECHEISLGGIRADVLNILAGCRCRPTVSVPAANVHGMLTAQTLIARPDFSVTTWRCTGEDEAWSEPECAIDGRVVLVRSGSFHRRGSCGPVEHDPTLGYLGEPGEREHFAHPHGGDVCTSVQLSTESWWQLAGEPQQTRPAPVYVDARLELAHRRLLGNGRSDPDYQVAEQLVQLVGAALRSAATRPIPASDSPSQASERRLVSRAREAIRHGDEVAAGLFPLAAALGVSPYRLSRSFSNVLGVSVTRYRNRVRVGRALDHLYRDDTTLADVAAKLGFADQAHFCRTLREQTGHTPTAVRRALRRVAAS